jgi:hypothetical protein
MTLIEGGAINQSRLSLRHVIRILKAMSSCSQLHDIMLAICYATSHSSSQMAETEWLRALEKEQQVNFLFQCEFRLLKRITQPHKKKTKQVVNLCI